MRSQGRREPSYWGYQRRETMPNLDLNNAPPSEGGDQEGISTQVGYGEGQGAEHGEPVLPPTIDVDAIEDEVVESSASAFEEAKSKSRRNHGRPMVVDVDLEDGRTRTGQTFGNKRRRVPLNQTIINCEQYINVESCTMRENARTAHIWPQSVPAVLPPPPPPPPKEPTFSCPICMGPLVEEMSTKCGHIFCKACIRAAITAQGKCPTCRKKVTVRGLIRVFLPATS